MYGEGSRGLYDERCGALPVDWASDLRLGRSPLEGSVPTIRRRLATACSRATGLGCKVLAFLKHGLGLVGSKREV